MRSLAVACTSFCLITLAGCVPRAAPPPAPPPPPAPTPAPPPPAPAPPPADWTIAPLTAGDWSYGGDQGRSSAAYGPAGAPVFLIRCEAGRISLARLGGNGTALIVRTSFGERRLPAGSPDSTATLAAADPLLDQMVFSRGRFLVQAEGAPQLIVPAWPEPARVIEDCRA